MKVSEVMSRSVRTTNPNASIQEAARMMAEIDAGALPVGENDRLVGMLTDRDIAVRAVAQGRGPEAKVRDVMTDDVRYCFEDDEIESIARNMADEKVSRLPVMNRDKRLVGIVSLGDIAVQGDGQTLDTAASGIKRPGGPKNQ